MSKSFTAVPPDSTGDRLKMRTYLDGGLGEVSSQGVYFDALPTYRAVSANQTPANSKWHIYLLNNTGSNQAVIILRAFYINLGTAAVTGVVNQFDVRRGTGATPTGGAAITPVAFNTADTGLLGVTAYGGATGGVTDGAVLQSMILSSEEQTASVGNFDRFTSNFPFLDTPLGGRPFTLRPGEGFGVKQNGTGTVGTFQWVVDFMVDPD
jgi:hypothetical protein